SKFLHALCGSTVLSPGLAGQFVLASVATHAARISESSFGFSLGAAGVRVCAMPERDGNRAISPKNIYFLIIPINNYGRVHHSLPGGVKSHHWYQNKIPKSSSHSLWILPAPFFS